MPISPSRSDATPSPSLTAVLICGGLMLTCAMGIRHGFGFWQLPMIQAHGWPRQTFALALALQNLWWGLAQPFVGMIADRFGVVPVIGVGALLYAAGLCGMGLAGDSLSLSLTAGLLIGSALACTTYSVVYGVIGRTATEAQRSRALGIAAAAGSFGQFAMVPIEQMMIASLGWQSALFWLAAIALTTMLPLAIGLREPPRVAAAASAERQTIGAAIREAFALPSFRLLMIGYFVCGFQVVFIAVHLPAYLKDQGMAPAVASWALALIGLFNIFGTYLAGVWGSSVPKKYLLAGIYFTRTIAIGIFLLLPITPSSVYAFAAVIGFLWLSTVPLTNGVIATIFGVRYLGMLSGFVFFSHQVGSFLGVWLGGWLYDRTGRYDWVWMIALLLGVLAGLVNLPIRERLLSRPIAAKSATAAA